MPPCWAITKILIDGVHLKVNSFAVSFDPQGKDFEYILLFSGALLSVGFLLWEFLKYKLIWYLTISLVGFSLMLHIVMTLKSLMVEQSDIKSNGYFFSFVTIYFLSVSLISGIIIFLVQGYMEALAFFSILLREVKNIFSCTMVFRC